MIKKEVPGLVGLKVSDEGGKNDWYKGAAPSSKERSLFIPAHHLATGTENEAHGAYSNMVCLNRFAAQKWYKQILKEGFVQPHRLTAVLLRIVCLLWSQYNKGLLLIYNNGQAISGMVKPPTSLNFRVALNT